MRTRELNRLANQLLTHLENDKRIENLHCYHIEKHEFYKTYYNITGFYKEEYFSISIRKSKLNEYTEIHRCVTEEIGDFKEYLKSITKLKFEII